MTGKLYLNFWGNRNRRMKAKRISVSLTEPNGARFEEKIIQLAPSKQLRNSFLYEGLTWEEYLSDYDNNVLGTEEGELAIQYIKTLLDGGTDVELLCWEEYMPCHRFILGEVFSRLGYKVKVIERQYDRDYENGECMVRRGILDRNF